MLSQSKYARRLAHNSGPEAASAPNPAAGAEPAQIEVRPTADGSLTLFVPALNEHYHSVHGARQESEHVFIEHGLRPVLRERGGANPGRTLNILEIGLGTGLNAILTLRTCRQLSAYAVYTALETRPLPPDVVEALAHAYFPPAAPNPEHSAQASPPCAINGPELPWLGEAFRNLHAAPWNVADQPPALVHDFYLAKILAPLETAQVVLSRHPGAPSDEAGRARLPAEHYHLIYFDAFAPDKQPELWTEAVFRTLHEVAAPGAVLVTYCAQGQFRRNLKAAGWLVEKLPGPLGKREMTRARKSGAPPSLHGTSAASSGR